MLIQLGEAWESHDNIVRVKGNYQRGYVEVTCRDGHVHTVGADYGRPLSEKEQKIVAKINAACQNEGTV